MKYLFVLVFLVGCTNLPSRNDEKSYQDRLGEKIENCMVRLKREGVDERLIGAYCDRTHREQPIEVQIEARNHSGIQEI